MAHNVTCENYEDHSDEIRPDATTYVVWRWDDERGYQHDYLCDACFTDLKNASAFRQTRPELEDILLIWAQSMDYLFDFGGAR